METLLLARECESPEHDATRHNARQLSGRKHVAARKACLGVLEGLKETREARKACVDMMGATGRRVKKSK